MAFRFQRRIKLFNGLSINFSKSGISTSVGVKGARMTFGHGKTRTTIGLPGTGLSHSTVVSNQAARVADENGANEQQPAMPTQRSWPATLWSVTVKLGTLALVAIAAVVGFFALLVFSSSKKRNKNGD